MPTRVLFHEANGVHKWEQHRSNTTTREHQETRGTDVSLLEFLTFHSRIAYLPADSHFIGSRADTPSRHRGDDDGYGAVFMDTIEAVLAINA